MKKQIILLIAALLLINIGCQDELEDNFINPGIYSPTENVPAGMFSGMMSRGRTFANDYGEFWWHAGTGGMISHSHLIMRHLRDSYGYFADANDVKVFYTLMSVDGYFYGHNSDFRELPLMEERVANMGDAEKADNLIYISLSKMVRGYRASKAVDLFNSVPYSEGLQGVNGQFFPKFDDPKEIYTSILDDLGTYSDQIVQEAAGMSADGKRLFEQQDIIFQGDVTKWQQWANALRLRLAVRMSGVDETYSKQVIAEILSKGHLPDGDLFIEPVSWVSRDGDHWKRGLKERDYAGFIPPTIMYKMDMDQDHEYTPGVDDPRLPVFFLPNRDTLYMPVSLDFGIGQKIYNFARAENIADYNYGDAYFYYDYFNELDRYMKYNAYSLWNPATMVRNVEPWRAFSRAEVDFLLAEAELKNLGNTGNSVENHLRNGVLHSIDYWYYVNSFSAWDKINDTNRFFLKPTAPDQNVKDQFATGVLVEYANAADLEARMEVIMSQKFVHLNIHDYLEVFTELRRTRHPKLPLIKFSPSLTLEPEVERYPYPGSEASTNTAALQEVSAQDNFTTPIFWVPADKKNVSYYEDSFNNDYLYTKYPGVPESFPN